MIDAATLLRSLVREPLATVRGRPNTVLEVDGANALVATARSPAGTPVPIAWVQEALDRLRDGETLAIDPSSVRYRSAFIGAVLRTVPYVEIIEDTPPLARVDPAAPISSEVLGEFEDRLRRYGDLIERAGPSDVPPSLLRELRIYGGASGIWTDTDRTRGIGGADAVTMGLLHTGRHYPDDLSDAALLYHYPETDRQAGRDRAEIDATKAAAELRLPVFVILQEGTVRTVRKGWVATWDDNEQLFLVEFGPFPMVVERGNAVDDEPFDLFEDSSRPVHTVRGRPNQQRFRMQVLQRYGGRCALCEVQTPQLLTAAHLIPDELRGLPTLETGCLSAPTTT